MKQSVSLYHSPSTSTFGSADSWEGVFWRIAAMVLGAVALLRGIRMPSPVNATQSLVNYDHGLVKRGFFGATVGKWCGAGSYLHFSIVSYAFLLIFLLLLVVLTVQSGLFKKLGWGELPAIFFSSYAVTYFGNTVGKFDLILAAIAIAVLLIKRPLVRFAAAVPGCVIGMLLHEMFLVVFLPILIFSFVLDILLSEEAPEEKPGLAGVWVMSGVLTLLCFAMAVKLSMRHALSAAEFSAWLQELGRRSDFAVDARGLDPYRLSFADNLHLVDLMFLHSWHFDLLWTASLATFSVAIAPILAASLCITRAGVKRSPRALVVLVVGCSLAPLAMNLLGVDYPRWNGLVCLNAYLVLALLCRAMPLQHLALPKRFQHVALLGMALSFSSGEQLLDHRATNAFPFVDSTEHIVHYVKGNGWKAPAE
jgi:hypothetical protein